MSARCVVLPRGINVGGHNRVPMAELRPKLVDAGYADPVTILQSGNIIVTADQPDQPDQPGDATGAAAVAASVQQLLADEFDVQVPCVARTAAKVEAILERNPLRHLADDGSRYLVNFLSDEPSPEAVRDLTEVDHSPEVVHVEGSEAYVWAPEGIKALRLTYAHLERHFGVTATARNWNTLERIAAKL